MDHHSSDEVHQALRKMQHQNEYVLVDETSDVFVQDNGGSNEEESYGCDSVEDQAQFLSFTKPSSILIRN